MDVNVVIKKPLITEKSMKETEESRYTFLVNRKANKNQIKKAIEKLFKVDVLNVRTIKIPGKTKRIGKRWQTKKMPNKKKAIIEIKKDQKIEAFPVLGKEGKS
jgi:large subunit ribosomal protein L23